MSNLKLSKPNICPRCRSSDYTADFVSVGVGYVQVGPYHCGKCGFVEPGCQQAVCSGGQCTSWVYCADFPGQRPPMSPGAYQPDLSRFKHAREFQQHVADILYRLHRD